MLDPVRVDDLGKPSAHGLGVGRGGRDVEAPLGVLANRLGAVHVPAIPRKRAAVVEVGVQVRPADKAKLLHAGHVREEASRLLHINARELALMAGNRDAGVVAKG